VVFEEIISYGDWDGRFFEKYEIIEDESNFMIIDKRGIVRYSKAGKVKKADILSIKKLLKKLSSGNV
jgi:predicted transcriptional regulator